MNENNDENISGTVFEIYINKKARVIVYIIYIIL